MVAANDVKWPGNMSSIAISVCSFGFFLGGALLGALLASRLPKHHLSDENKELVRLAMALVGTLTAIALGLLIGSAKTYYAVSNPFPGGFREILSGP